jgi:hypothetical protein
MYADATATAKLIVWTYDIKTHLTTMMDVGYTKEICEKLKVPHVIENCPQSLLVYVQEEDRQAFTDAYKSMDQGSDLATCVFGFQLPSQPVMAYERIVLKRINDRDGNLLTVYGYGQNVSEEKLKEERYELAYQQLNKAYPDSLGSFHLNLTKNWCGEGRSTLDFVMKQQDSGTVDGYFEAFSKLIADEDVKRAYFKLFDRKALIQKFNEGTTSVSIEYPIIREDHIRHWRKGLLFMLRNPRTNDVEAVTLMPSTLISRRGMVSSLIACLTTILTMSASSIRILECLSSAAAVRGSPMARLVSF